MKPVDIESSIGLDRLATFDEVRGAMLFSSQGTAEPVGSSDDLLGVHSDLSAQACNPSEDMMWLAIVSAMPDSTSN